MRGQVDRQQSIFVVFDLEQRVPMEHPLRKIKRWADHVLASMSRDFNKAYGTTGKPGIPPEQLLKALLLQALYSIPSETKLVEAIEYNVLYRWFLDLPMEHHAWTQEAFSMNRDRFEIHDLHRKFFDRVVAECLDQSLASPDHFSIDGTLIRSLASHKSLQPIGAVAGETAQDSTTKTKQSREKKNQKAKAKDKDKDQDGGTRDELVDWQGQKRSNATHRSTTDPDARLARKGNGREAHLCHCGHVMMDKDRKSTRLNSSHKVISYAVFCLKKKKKKENEDVVNAARVADASKRGVKLANRNVAVPLLIGSDLTSLASHSSAVVNRSKAEYTT